MKGSGYSKLNRILASYMAVCMVAMAFFPYTHISRAVENEDISTSEGSVEANGSEGNGETDGNKGNAGNDVGNEGNNVGTSTEIGEASGSEGNNEGNGETDGNEGSEGNTIGNNVGTSTETGEASGSEGNNEGNGENDENEGSEGNTVGNNVGTSTETGEVSGSEGNNEGNGENDGNEGSEGNTIGNNVGTSTETGEASGSEGNNEGNGENDGNEGSEGNTVGNNVGTSTEIGEASGSEGNNEGNGKTDENEGSEGNTVGNEGNNVGTSTEIGEANESEENNEGNGDNEENEGNAENAVGNEGNNVGTSTEIGEANESEENNEENNEENGAYSAQIGVYSTQTTPEAYNPSVSDVEILVNSVSSKYAKKGDTIKITFIGMSFKSPTVKFFSKDNTSEGVETDTDEEARSEATAVGGEPWIIEREITETDSFDGFNYYIYDTYNGTTTLVYSGTSDIIIDNEAPATPSIRKTTNNTDDIRYGGLGSNKATINFELSDNFDVKSVLLTVCGESWTSENAVWTDITPNNFDGYKETSFDAVFTSSGSYKIKAVDAAGNESTALSFEIGKGDTLYMEIVQPASKTTFTKAEIDSIITSSGLDKASLLAGGRLAAGYTFTECSDTSQCDKVCICQENCSCSVNGSCTVDNGCQKYVYECEIHDMTWANCEVDNVDEMTKKVYLIHPNNSNLTANYLINIVPGVTYVSPTFSEPGNASTEITATIDNFSQLDLTDMKYTWSSTSGDVGKEMYRADFADDNIFTYVSVVGDTSLAWYADEGEYKAPQLVLNKGDNTKLSALATITIKAREETESEEVSGVVSFEYLTQTRNGDNFTVSINGTEAMDPVAGILSEWRTFSKECTSVGGNITLELLYEISGITTPVSSEPIIIRNLVFEGEKKWYPLESGTVTLGSILGPQNYLWIEGKTSDGATVRVHSEAYKGAVVLQGIEIDTVPTKTVYYYDSGSEASINTSGGKITLLYDVGSEKIDMSKGVISVNNDGEFEENIDLGSMGVKEVKVSYTAGNNTHYAYYPILVCKDSESSRSGEANAPDLLNGMIPVRWYEGTSESYWITTLPSDTEWYTYVGDEHQWANVMLRDNIKIREVEDVSEVKDLKLLAGKRVTNEGSSYVWIPRFTYKIGDEKTDIKWSSGVNDDTTDGYSSHSAFTYGTNELNGFWIAKYEASNGVENGEVGKVASKPGVVPYYEMKVNKVVVTGREAVSLADAYDLSLGMSSESDNGNLYNNVYGIDFSNAVTHLIKQGEWGAVAILSYSTYGVVPFINNYRLNSSTLNTGYVGDSADSEAYTAGDKNKGETGYIYNLSNADDSFEYMSTSGNIYGVFDMSGGAEEYVASYVKKSTTDTSYDNYDVKNFDIVDLSSGASLYNALVNKNDWATLGFSNENTSWNGESDITLWNADIVNATYTLNADDTVKKDKREAFFRGGNAEGKASAGILAMTITYADGKSGNYGFRPTIVVLSKQQSTVNTLSPISIAIQGSTRSWAKAGDKVDVTIKSNGAIDRIEDFKFSQGTGENLVEMEYSEYTDGFKEWTFTYEVQPGDSGKLSFSFVHDGVTYTDTTDGSEVKMDTNANAADIDVSTGDGKVTITVSPDKEDGESNIDKIVIKDSEGNIIGELGSTGGNIDVNETGNYTVEVEDQAGNKTETTIVVSSGLLNGQINNIVPKLTNLVIGVLLDLDEDGVKEYVNITSELKTVDGVEKFVSDVSGLTNRKFILNGDTVKFDMTFDQELTVGPRIIIPEARRVNAQIANGNATTWTAEFEMDSLKAYTDFVFEISRFKYGSNVGSAVTESDTGFEIPYDGSNVNVDISIPKTYQRSDETEAWTEVDTIDKKKLTKLEYVVTFSDITSGPGDSPVDNFDTDYGIRFSNVSEEDGSIDITLSPNDITIYDGLRADDVIISDVMADGTVVNSNQKVITFINAAGTGRFIFGIRGASVLNPDVENPIVKDIYGHPNNQTETSGNSAIWLTPDPGEIREYTVFYDANGGINPPASQTKERNVNLLLTTDVPSKEGYVFDHWEGYSPDNELFKYYPNNTATGNMGVYLYDAEGSVYESYSDRYYRIDSDISLYASYVAIDYTVTAVLVDVNDATASEDDIGLVEGTKDSSGVSIVYHFGDLVTLVAVPENGYTFVEWESLTDGFTISGDNVSNERISFSMPAKNISVKAKFVKYVVSGDIIDIENENATPENVGAVNGFGAHSAGTEVTLVATPKIGYHFYGWEAVPEDLTLSVEEDVTTTKFTMPKKNVSVNAKFEKTMYSVTITKNPELGGMVSASNEGIYYYNDPVELVATANPGYEFTGWTVKNGALSLSDTSGSTITFNMPAEDVTIQANFNQLKYNVNANASEGGTTSGSGQYTYRSLVSVSATANEGYEFDSWVGVTGIVLTDSQLKSNAVSFDMPNSDISMTATFSKIGYNVNIIKNIEDAGSVSGAGTYTYGDEVDISVSTTEGYRFDGWSVVGGNVMLNSFSAESTSFNMPAANVTIQANFSALDYTVTVEIDDSVPNSGDVDGAGTYHLGDTVKLVATPRDGYKFVSWSVVSGEITLSSSTLALTTFEMPASNVTVKATFAKGDYSVTLIASPEGSGVVGGNGSYNLGDIVEIVASPAAGYIFNGWTIEKGEVTLTNASALNTSFTMIADSVILRANFVRGEYMVTANVATPNTGSVSGGGTYKYEDTVTLSATPESGYKFSSWTVNEGGVVLADTATVTFNMPSNDVSVTATFVADEYDVTILKNVETGGTVTGAGKYNYGGTVNIEAECASGYKFDGWTVISGGVILNSPENLETSFTMPATNVILQANFSGDEYQVTATASPTRGGTVDGGGSYACGDTVTLVADSDSGYKFVSWNVVSGDITLSSSTSRRTTFTMPANDVEIEAIFQKKDYKVTLISNPSAGGTLTGAGTYSYKSTVNVSVTPNQGYTFTGWAVITGDVEFTDYMSTSLSFDMPSSNVVLQANFDTEVYTVTYDGNGGVNVPEAQTKIIGQTITLSYDVPTKEGYTFVSWNTSVDGSGDSYLPGARYSANASVTLYAQWTVAEYEIRYNANGGFGAPEMQRKTHNVNIVLSDVVPSKETGIFVGWSTSQDSVVADYQPGDTYSANASVTLYAIWRDAGLYILTTYDGEGTVASASHLENEEVWLGAPETYNGLYFKYWEATGITLNAAQVNNASMTMIMPGNDVVLRAHYAEISEISYTIEYNANGGSEAPESQTKAYGVDVTLRTDIPTRQGYVFEIWNTNADGSGTEYSAGANYTANAGVILYAQWAVASNVPYKVEHYKENADGSYSIDDTLTDNLTGTTGETVTAVAKTIENYTEDTSHVDRVASGVVEADGSLVLKLYYYRNSYTITFNSNGGSDVTAITQKHGTDVTAPEAPTRAGYTFNGWLPEVPSTMPTEDITCVAQWTANSDITYKVEHYKENADGSYSIDDTLTDNLTGTTGETVTAVAKTIENYTEDTSHVDRVASGVVEADGSLVLKLYYYRNSYTITFNSNGGSDVTAITQKHGTDVTAPEAPTRAGYTFNGWLPEVPSTMPTEDITCVAQWTANSDITYKVEHYKENADGSYSIDDTLTDNLTGTTGETVTAVAKTIENYTENTSHVDRVASGVIEADGSLVLKLYYYRNSYTITFNSNGGSDVTAITQKHGTDVTAPEAPTRAGYTFNGWLPEVPSTMPTEDITCVAQWTANSYVLTVETVNSKTYGEEATGTELTITAQVVEGYTFTGWTATGITLTETELASDTITFMMPGNDVTLVANYQETLVDTGVENGEAE